MEHVALRTGNISLDDLVDAIVVFVFAVDTSMFKWTDDTGPVDIQSKTAL
jgi:hypothetical protein